MQESPLRLGRLFQVRPSQVNFKTLIHFKCHGQTFIGKAANQVPSVVTLLPRCLVAITKMGIMGTVIGYMLWSPYVSIQHSSLLVEILANKQQIHWSKMADISETSWVNFSAKLHCLNTQKSKINTAALSILQHLNNAMPHSKLRDIDAANSWIEEWIDSLSCITEKHNETKWLWLRPCDWRWNKSNRPEWT